MNLLVVTFAAALAGAGLLLVIRGLIGTTVPLTVVVADLHRLRTDTTPATRRDRTIEVLAGRPSSSRDAVVIRLIHVSRADVTRTEPVHVSAQSAAFAA